MKPSLHLGFTGTQNGMNDYQKAKLADFIYELLDLHQDITLHHGDCIGADAEAHSIARVIAVRTTRVKIQIHPPSNSAKRAFCQGAERIWPMLPYLLRNRKIVEASQRVVATPGEMTEQLRSGTWSTVRYAERRGMLVTVIKPYSATMEGA